MASKTLDDLSNFSPPFLPPLPHSGCALPPTPVVLNLFTIRSIRQFMCPYPLLLEGKFCVNRNVTALSTLYSCDLSYPGTQ